MPLASPHGHRCRGFVLTKRHYLVIYYAYLVSISILPADSPYFDQPDISVGYLLTYCKKSHHEVFIKIQKFPQNYIKQWSNDQWLVTCADLKVYLIRFHIRISWNHKTKSLRNRKKSLRNQFESSKSLEFFEIHSQNQWKSSRRKHEITDGISRSHME